MPRIRLLAALLALAALVALAGPASATSSISLDPVADWSNSGTTVDLSGITTCSGGLGAITVTLTQNGRTGSAVWRGHCTGQPQPFGVTVTGGPFTLGAAQATASLTAPSGNATTSRTVQLQ